MPDWDEPPLRLRRGPTFVGRDSLRPNQHTSECWRSIRIAKSRRCSVSPVCCSCAATAALREICCCAAAASRLVGPMPGTSWASRCCRQVTSRWRNRRSPRRSAWRPDNVQYALHRVDAASAAGLTETLLALARIRRRRRPAEFYAADRAWRAAGTAGASPRSDRRAGGGYALAPDAPLPAALLGECSPAANRLQEAEAALRRACELDPDNPALRNARATMLYRACSVTPKRGLALLDLIERNGERAGRPVQSGQRHHLRRRCRTKPWPRPPRDRACARRHQCRDGRCAMRCRIATASPAPSSGGAQDCSDRLPRETPAAVRQRARAESATCRRPAVGLVQDASGRLADRRRLRDARSRVRSKSSAWHRTPSRRPDGAPVPRLARDWHDVDRPRATRRSRLKARAARHRHSDRSRRLRRRGAHACLRLPPGAGAGEMGRHAEPQLRPGGDGLDHHRPLGDAAEASSRSIPSACCACRTAMCATARRRYAPDVVRCRH